MQIQCTRTQVAVRRRRASALLPLALVARIARTNPALSTHPNSYIANTVRKN